MSFSERSSSVSEKKITQSKKYSKEKSNKKEKESNETDKSSIEININNFIVNCKNKYSLALFDFLFPNKSTFKIEELNNIFNLKNDKIQSYVCNGSNNFIFETDSDKIVRCSIINNNTGKNEILNLVSLKEIQKEYNKHEIIQMRISRQKNNYINIPKIYDHYNYKISEEKHIYIALMDCIPKNFKSFKSWHNIWNTIENTVKITNATNTPFDFENMKKMLIKEFSETSFGNILYLYWLPLHYFHMFSDCTHNDFHPGNVFFLKKKWYFIDFSKSICDIFNEKTILFDYLTAIQRLLKESIFKKLYTGEYFFMIVYMSFRIIVYLIKIELKTKFDLNNDKSIEQITNLMNQYDSTKNVHDLNESLEKLRKNTRKEIK